MFRSKFLVGGMIFVALATFALGQGFKSKDAVAARAQFVNAKAALDKQYATELGKLQKKYIADLTQARKAAIEANDLDEAQAIVATIKEVEGSIPVAGGELTSQDFANKTFILANVSSSTRITFGKDGKVVAVESPIAIASNADNIPKEFGWKFADKSLFITDNPGRPATRLYRTFRVSDQNRIYCEELGLGRPPSPTCILREVPAAK